MHFPVSDQLEDCTADSLSSFHPDLSAALSFRWEILKEIMDAQKHRLAKFGLAVPSPIGDGDEQQQQGKEITD